MLFTDITMDKNSLSERIVDFGYNWIVEPYIIYLKQQNHLFDYQALQAQKYVRI